MVEITADPIRPLAEDMDRRIHWLGTFHSPRWEKYYRQHELPDSIKLIRALVGFVVGAFLISLVNDYGIFGAGAKLGGMIALRVIVFALLPLVLFFIRPGMPPGRFDALVAGWAMMTKIVMLIILASRPGSFVGQNVVMVLSIALTYWILPVPLLWRAIPCWFMTAGALVLGYWINPWPDQPTALATTLALVLVNFLGGEMCREQQVWRRRQFLALTEQKELSASLEKALGEIKTLRGILPICMHCKRISDDMGHWEQIENYVRQHSDVQFSHGLCPDCARNHYPEIDWDDARREREQRLKATERPS